MKLSAKRSGGFNRAVSYLLREVFRLFTWTLKVEVHGWEHIEAVQRSGRLLLLGTWHGHILSLFLVRTQIQLPYLTGMISRSSDGDIAAEAVQRFGMYPVRGSSSRGGAPAVLAFRKQIREHREQGRAVAAVHLLDGPRGPRHKTKPGLLSLARQNEALIVPFVTGAAPCRFAGSWDRHMIPLPFSRLSIRFGPPIDVLTETPAGEVTPETIDARMDELAQGEPMLAADRDRGSA